MSDFPGNVTGACDFEPPSPKRLRTEEPTQTPDQRQLKRTNEEPFPTVQKRSR